VTPSTSCSKVQLTYPLVEGGLHMMPDDTLFSKLQQILQLGTGSLTL